jgi:hypothetical protein
MYVSVRRSPRLFTVEEEVAVIRPQTHLANFDMALFSGLDEARRRNHRNDWLAQRMYAIDLNYTTYEANLTRERQGVGFGAAAATIGLTTASTLVTPVTTKNVLTSLAGAVTGARAAYEDDILLAHSMQWIQSQMRTQRARVADRIRQGMSMTTAQYPLAVALSDLEDYYRAGTFTGGLLSTTETVAAEARLAEELKDDRVEVAFAPTPAAQALRACLLRPGVTADQLVGLMTTPSRRNFAAVLSGHSPAAAEALLQRARIAGIC